MVALVRRGTGEISELGDIACWRPGLRFVGIILEQTETPRSDPSLCGLG